MLFPEFPVCNTIKCHASGHYKIFLPGDFICMSCEKNYYLLGDFLHRSSNIHFPSGNPAFHLSCGSTKKLCKFIVGHILTLIKIKVIQIKPVRTVRLDIDDFLPDKVIVYRISIRSKPHKFIIPGIYLKSAECSESTIQKAK